MPLWALPYTVSLVFACPCLNSSLSISKPQNMPDHFCLHAAPLPRLGHFNILNENFSLKDNVRTKKWTHFQWIISWNYNEFSKYSVASPASRNSILAASPKPPTYLLSLVIKFLLSWVLTPWISLTCFWNAMQMNHITWLFCLASFTLHHVCVIHSFCCRWLYFSLIAVYSIPL